MDTFELVCPLSVCLFFPEIGKDRPNIVAILHGNAQKVANCSSSCRHTRWGSDSQASCARRSLYSTRQLSRITRFKRQRPRNTSSGPRSLLQAIPFNITRYATGCTSLYTAHICERKGQPLDFCHSGKVGTACAMLRAFLHASRLSGTSSPLLRCSGSCDKGRLIASQRGLGKRRGAGP